jgi:hypothetical protein
MPDRDILVLSCAQPPPRGSLLHRCNCRSPQSPGKRALFPLASRDVQRQRYQAVRLAERKGFEPVISLTERAGRDRGDASGWKWAAVRKPDTAAAHCKAASLRRSTKRQAGSSIAGPARPKTHRSRPRPGHEKTRRGDPGGHGSTPISEILPNGPPRQAGMQVMPGYFPPIRGKVALRKRTAPRPAVAASRRAKVSPLDG